MMKNLEAIRTTGQESLKRLVVLGKQQPSEIKTWGVTATAAVAGGIALTATAQGIVALFATLASPPVALTVGAIGGGVLGWLYVSRPTAQTKVAPTELEEVATGSAPAPATAATGTGEVAFSEITASETTTNETPVTEPIGAEPLVTNAIAPEISVNDSSSSAVVEPQPAPVNTLQVEPPNNEPTEETPAALAVQDGDANASLDATRAGEPLPLTPEPLTGSAPTEPTVAMPLIQQDNLEVINGIGPIFAKRLQDAGIHTFAQLAALTPEQLQEIVASSRGSQMIHADEWIAQAHQLANTATN